MRFLLLSDLHVGAKHSAAQGNALSSLVDAVGIAAGDRTFDAILLAGDIAYAGLDAQYRACEEMLLSPLRATPSFRSAKIVAIPGNHDIDCTAVDAIQWSAIGRQRRETYFEETDAGQAARAPRARGFAAYTSFAQRNGILTAFPAQSASWLHTIGSSAASVHLICTNTAYFSDRDEDVLEYEHIPAPTPSLESVLRSLQEGGNRVVLGHHPIGWFRHEDREPFKSLLVKHSAVYLHGHEHEPQASFGADGLISLGLGAVYQNRLQPEKKDWYRNSFAIADLATDALHVSIVEWDPKAGRWGPCHSLPIEFEEPSTRFEHGSQLRLSSRRSRKPVQFPKRAGLRIERVFAASELSAGDWRRLLIRARVLEQQNVLEVDGSSGGSVGARRESVSEAGACHGARISRSIAARLEGEPRARRQLRRWSAPS